jgi:hypothetical protein
VNTALWGQFDVLLAFLLLAALLALLHDRPLLAGAVLGAAFATKLLAVVVFPPVAVWIARRHRARQLLLAIAAGILVALLFAAPHAVHGRGAAVLKAYTGAVNYYPFRTAEAYNGWYVLDRFDQRVRALGPEARRDDRPALGPVTWRHLGLGAFAAFTLAVLAALARRPEPNVLVWACVLQAFGFFMLPTQVHQRYVVPAALLATLLVPFSRRGVWLFAGLTLTATLNQGIDLARALPWREVVPGALTTADLGLATRTARDLGALVGLLNLALFAFACWAFAREVRGAPASTVSRPA